MHRDTAATVHAYYATFREGGAHFDPAHLLAVLHPDVLFEAPLVGQRRGAEALVPGVQRFATSVTSFRMIQELCVGNEMAVLYDCSLTRPAGTHRFAEFFRVENGRITELRLLFDATEYRKLA
jgi:ketosteroid isomerase-like protein